MEKNNVRKITDDDINTLIKLKKMVYELSAKIDVDLKRKKDENIRNSSKKNIQKNSSI